MKQSFGELILKKYSVLYYNTNNKYDKIMEHIKEYNKLDNLYFHPLQELYSKYLYKIILKKDVSLFCEFYLKKRKDNIISIFHPILDVKYSNKIYELFHTKLLENNFDGCIKPQFCKNGNPEIYIFNPLLVLDIEKIEYIQTWDKKNIVEFHGNYPICFSTIKPIFNLNKSYKNNIKSYIDFIDNTNNKLYKKDIFFYLLFLYSEINYHDVEERNISHIILN